MLWADVDRCEWRPDAAGAGEMVFIPGGTFLMGSDRHYPEEAPSHPVALDGFWIDRTPVTNRQFKEFVNTTGYVTTAQIVSEDLSGTSTGALYAGSLVFAPLPLVTDLGDERQWWRLMRAANWRHPCGPGSNIRDLDDHPVVHVAYRDAAAYAAWAGKDLPSEAEWEYAARGGLDGEEYAWGNTLTPGGRHMANIWQGDFPAHNLREDGYERTSPVTAFPPNGYGVYDMIGNVWEWTSDWWSAHSTSGSHGPWQVSRSPRGGSEADSQDPGASQGGSPRKVLKGGSHLCAPNHCRRYRPAARRPEQVDSSASDIGFRCVVRLHPDTRSR
ncbi:formylglycine-generating enzyme family protein [Bradyrhizobium manausense]|uniref:formylglycine-generating enzyme family protein n=1 Tax=Bradyrhizobium TaxID=374 RepID=UPI001BA53E53|nr:MULTISPECIES: formylglycine-generating enzyme family protein [Bradyrhizobium]MBR0830076.1 formylglycine-generating enzyme family protein [Bradyrhizobium manausense]UVO30946.1 formylglycine-generating enzyme family protein [Bradyrhizobium arachidis]